MKNSLLPIVIGYILILTLIGAIGYAYYNEEHTLAMMDHENESANGLRSEINWLNTQLTTLSLMGETAVEWTEDEMAGYHRQRMRIDSALCFLKDMYCPNPDQSEMDSLRSLLALKEERLCELADISRRQKALSDEMADRLPVIARQSEREDHRKPRRKGFLGLFGKKEEPSPTATTTMLYRFNHSLVAQRRLQNELLKAHADSLSRHNRLLNARVQELVRHLDGKATEKLQQREEEIAATRKESYRDIGILTTMVLLVLLAALVKIHLDIRRDARNRQRLEESIRQNRSLLEMRKKIILTISHDIRGPLNVISGSTELALGTRDKRKRDGYLNNVRYLCRHVVHLLNNLLDIYRLNEAKETPNNVPFRLDALLDRIATGAEQVINDKGLLFIHDFRNVDVTVCGDGDRISQIADNLLSNAVKFTDSGTIGISAEYDDGTLLMDVSDTGMGMTEETIERIFHPFERAGNVEHLEGFGLGLSITKGLVSLLGGTIDVISEPGNGTVFHVAVPLPPAEASLVPESPAAEPDGELRLPVNVLAVDDDPLQCGIVREMLERNSVSCTVCTTASAIVRAMREKDYDMLLSDINMPGTNGFALLELLRRSNIGNSRTIPVIAMTARDDDDSWSLLDHGFSGCIFKPFSTQELLERISAVHSRHRSAPEVDLSVLTAQVGDKAGILRTFADSTMSDIQALETAVEKNDRRAIGDIIHRIRPVWTMLRLDAELQPLRAAVKDRRTPAEDIRAMSGRVTTVMEMLVRNVNEEMEVLRHEEQDTDS